MSNEEASQPVMKLELEIKVRNAECLQILQEFPQAQVAAMHLVLLYNLEFNRKLFGGTLQEFSKHLRLLQALNDGSDYAILCERTWRHTLRFMDQVFLVPDLGHDDVTVVFRVDQMLGERCASERPSDIWDDRIKNSLDNFRGVADQLMNTLIATMEGVEGHMHGGSGWLQLSKAYLVKEFMQSKPAFENPIEHQVKCMRSMLIGFNEASGTHWHCARIRLEEKECPTTSNPLLVKKRQQQWEQFVKLNSHSEASFAGMKRSKHANLTPVALTC